jgi:hypothetical protein
MKLMEDVFLIASTEIQTTPEKIIRYLVSVEESLKNNATLTAQFRTRSASSSFMLN